MSKRASPTAIGAFVVGAVALIVIGVLVFGGGKFFRHPIKYALFFDISVEGLNVGAPVQWRGVKVGQVSQIESRWGTQWIEVIVDLDPRSLRGGRDLDPREIEERIARNIKESGLRAQLRTQSLLTGQLFVAIDLFPDTEIKLTGFDQSLPELPVVPTTFQVFSERAEKFLDTLVSLPLPQLIESTTNAVDAINKVARSKELHQILEQANATLDQIQTLARTVNEQGGPLLASAKETIDTTRTSVTDVAQDARKLLSQLDVDANTLNALLQGAQQVVQKTDGEIGSVASAVRGTLEAVGVVLERAQGTLSAIDSALAKAQVTLGSADGTMGGDTPLGYQLLNTLQDLGAASRAVRTLADYLDQHPEALLKGKGSPGGK
jgi:paraquat-inducible protein B